MNFIAERFVKWHRIFTGFQNDFFPAFVARHIFQINHDGFAYAFALARAMQTVHPFRARIETENGINEFETMMIVLGNGRFHAGPFPLSPDASIREGLLSVYALRARDKMAFLRLALRLPFGTQGDLEEVHAEETEGGTLWTEPVMAVTVDGEICRRTPSKFGVAYRALRVVVPLGADL